MTHRTIRTLSALLVFAFAFTAFAAEKTVQKSFDACEGGCFTLNTKLADVKVVPGTGDQVKVSVTYVTESNDPEVLKSIMKMMCLDGDCSEGLVNLCCKRQAGTRLGSEPQQYAVKFLVEVPPAYEVMVNTIGGDIALENLQGTVRAEVTGGTIQVSGCTGNVQVQTNQWPQQQDAV